MHEYDTVLKALLQSPQNTIFERITGAKIDRWLNVEFPEVQQTRVDMLGLAATERKRLLGLELQSANDMKLPLRMAEYALRTYRLYEAFPDQYVLYVGDEEMRMPSELVGPNFVCRYTIFDIRTLDEESLLTSPFASDSIMAILTRHRDRRQTIQRILQRIATLEGGRRDDAFKKLMILAGLRELEDSIREEAKQMPILNDIMDHKVFGPLIRQGRQEGELTILRGQLGKRFGTMPAWVDDRLAELSTAELEDLSLRLFDAKSLDELFLR
jgi:predicted transposase YdaD